MARFKVEYSRAAHQSYPEKVDEASGLVAASALRTGITMYDNGAKVAEFVDAEIADLACSLLNQYAGKR